MVEDRRMGGQAMSYSVSQIARLAGVSVRTLHHYDQIGLLSPAGRSGAGYRRYGDDDLRRLQQIMFYRELGFALSDITDMVSDPDAEPAEHLRRQHGLLVARLERTRRLVTAVERAMEAEKLGISLTPEERLEVFGDHDPAQWTDEVTERWGDTDAYRQARQRMRSYGKDDWLAIKAEAVQITAAFVAARAAGQAPDSAAATSLAEQHRQHISHWFYDCPPEMHRGLGEMYVADSRFAANYESLAPGLAAYVRDAFAANAELSGL
jgi:MerR family transcriptional regulator, thiopeptide resistance regulator